MRKPIILTSAGALLLSSVSAFAQEVTLNYAMWDGLQVPAYRKCADGFEAANPGIKVKIAQDGWDNYWTSLTTSFISGGAPDVFVNHVSRFPDLMSNGNLLDLTPMVDADKVDLNAYRAGLAKTWNADGKQWGLPKDWDTIALVYSKQAVADAGISDADLQNMTWNPDDGGTFGKIVAKLAVDNNGKRGDDPAFDKASVKQYGFLSTGDAVGQDAWGSFAASTGFKYIDQPFGKKWLFDDPRLAKSLTYFRDLAIKQGVAVSRELAGSLGPTALFVSGKVAMAPQGSWTIASLKDTAPGPFGFAPMPTGPEGRRSMMNGLADSIASTTQHPDEAWKWVRYLGSAACQDVVGQSAVVFPALPSGTDAAIAKLKADGIDPNAFTEIAKAETTFGYPLTTSGSEIIAILTKAVEQVLLNQGDAATDLKAANDEANALLQ